MAKRINPERSIQSELLYKGKIVTLRKDTVLLDQGRLATREVVEHPGAVGILPFSNEEVVLVRQYRYPVGSTLLEIPAGKLEPGENPVECAKRELKEETGLVASKLEYVCSFHTSPGFCNEVLHLFFAEGLQDTAPEPDADENLQILRVKRSQIRGMIRGGQIKDAKTIIALLILEDILANPRT
ncbi:MAG TPA: NUDIX hydrolase [Firmicutes bacterium]|nr:NUDIX hydrolase [Bacillota bacterium]